jgi:small subunit ribosomal protein S27e
MTEESIAPVHARFVKVACPDCSHKQILFARTSTQVSCATCGKTLAEPRGGRALLHGEILDELQ